MTTHYVMFDSPGWTSRYGRATCGALIEVHKEFSATPSCPTCAAWVRDLKARTDEAKEEYP